MTRLRRRYRRVPRCGAVVALTLSILVHAPMSHAQTATGPAAPVATTTGSGAASAPAAQSGNPEPSTYDRIWKNFTELYKNDKNPAVQQVLFTGRFQHDLVALHADRGEHDESNVRRVRFGPRITFLKKYVFHAEIEVNPQERNPFYMRFTDLYVQWNRSGALAVTVGKQSMPFTQEGATSSKELLTIDRSNLANNIWFTQEYMPGVSVSGRRAPWIYRAGVYSAGAANRELGEFNGDYFTLAVLGYDFAKRFGVKEAVLTGNYLYQHPDGNNTFTQRLEHIGSVHLRLEADRWGLRTDLSRADGYLGQSDLSALMLMPFINATKKLQLVGRYTLVDSDDPNGVRLANYESKVVSGRGDRYDEVYLGVNYFLYGHKLKLQSGVQFAEMDDRAPGDGAYSGVSWTSGLRVGW